MADLTIDITPILAQLSSDVLIEELRRRLGLSSQADDASGVGQANNGSGRDSGPVGQVRPDEFFRLSVPEAVKKYLAIMKRPQGPKTIVEGLQAGGLLSNSKNFYGVVYKEIMRMDNRGELVNTPSGWALSDWYPNKPKPNETPRPRKKARKPTGSARPKALRDGSMIGALKQKGNGVTGGAKSPYRRFLAEQLALGIGMKEANATWKARKQEEG